MNEEHTSIQLSFVLFPFESQEETWWQMPLPTIIPLAEVKLYNILIKTENIEYSNYYNFEENIIFQK